jgi:uncharacterized protein YjbI with pentapeptide repeats
MPVPQTIDDLAYTKYLEPFDGPLAREGNYASLHLADLELDGFAAGNARFDECAFTGVTLSNGSFARARINDVWFDRTRLIGMNLSETEWLDAAFLNSMLAGVEAFGGRLRRVTFQECKINTLNLRGATVQEVVFDRCEIIELDISTATVTNLTFPGSSVERLRLDKATLKKVDFRGATELDVASGAAALNGAIINDTQLAMLAPALADTIGIVVKSR